MHLACILLRISMEEALVAATLHSAISLGKEATHGSLQVGKMADLIVLNAPRYLQNSDPELIIFSFHFSNFKMRQYKKTIYLQYFYKREGF